MGTQIEVIGAGLGHTGTKSLQAALDALGYRTFTLFTLYGPSTRKQGRREEELIASGNWRGNHNLLCGAGADQP